MTRLYARDGDIVGLRSGETLTVLKGDSQGQTWFEAAGPVWMMAGRDIVASGTGLGVQLDVPSSNGYNLGGGGGAWVGSSGNLFLHRDAREVSRCPPAATFSTARSRWPAPARWKCRRAGRCSWPTRPRSPAWAR
ncbi:hypothetical protein WJ972_13305 [Achromobacter insuavis]